jgi:dynein heavy chain
MYDKTEDEIKAGPNDGCYIRGLYMEGARWDSEIGQIGESKPKELFSEVPIIWLVPSINRIQPAKGIYVCPVYKTITRAGKK